MAASKGRVVAPQLRSVAPLSATARNPFPLTDFLTSLIVLLLMVRLC